MPKIEQQLPPRAALPKALPSRSNGVGSVLDRIVPVARVTRTGIKVSIYGRSKTGKTRLACTFPKPLLIIGGEDGTESVANVKDVYFVRISDSYEVATLAENAVSKGFKSVVVDTASSVQDLKLKEVLGLSDIPEQKSWGLATREQWGQVSLETKTLLWKVLELPLNVVVIAHERNFKEEGDGEIIVPTVGSALVPAVTGWLNGKCSYICQTFIREESRQVETVIGVGKNAQKVYTKELTGGKEYCLRTGQHSVYTTGFRVLDNVVVPDVIVNPSYDKIMKAIKGEKLD